jgi:hypothetical protein
MGRKGEAPDHGSKGKAPELRSKGEEMIWGITLLLLSAKGTIVERGLLPTLSYMERKGERERIHPF